MWCSGVCVMFSSPTGLPHVNRTELYQCTQLNTSVAVMQTMIYPAQHLATALRDALPWDAPMLTHSPVTPGFVYYQSGPVLQHAYHCRSMQTRCHVFHLNMDGSFFSIKSMLTASKYQRSTGTNTSADR